MGNPVFGASWERVVVETILSNLRDWSPYFYRTATGDETNLVLKKGNRTIAVECKASTAPQLTKGFFRTLNDLQADHAYVIIPSRGAYPVKTNVTVCGIEDFLSLINPSKV